MNLKLVSATVALSLAAIGISHGSLRHWEYIHNYSEPA